ncbi:MAG: hypothetical protein GY772_32510 [bacterium]|nr:hypothetical protein [bacterium]
MRSAFSDSSGCSVDTDIDSEVEADKKAARRLHATLSEKLAYFRVLAPAAALAPEAALAHEGSPGPGEDALPPVPPEDEESLEDDAAARLPRHPNGTWTIWSSAWFYMTQTPGWMDLKIIMREGFKDYLTGMGCIPGQYSKTLTPHHYHDDWDDPWRTKILLRAWALWRCRCLGWAAARPSRARDALQQSHAMVRDLRSAHGGAATWLVLGVFGSVRAHAHLLEWVPAELAAAMLPES